MRRLLRPLLLLSAFSFSTGCAYQYAHEIQWNSASQIWQAEASQVKVRSAQSRVFDTSDRTQVLEATVATFQDLGFQINVLDPELGIVSGRKYMTGTNHPEAVDVSYLRYDPEALIVFNENWRTWGPFWNRSDLVRLTATVRPRNAEQLIVRASAQYFLRPIEDPEPYQHFFRTLEQALFAARSSSH